MSSDSRLLSSSDIVDLLSEIGRRLRQEGRIAEVAIFGGSAISLMFDFRDSTRDVDVMPVSDDISRVKAISVEMSGKYGLNEDWLNDAVEIFKSDNAEHQFFGEFPKEAPGIRVFTATPQYLMAMKILSMRSSLESHDVRDIWHLADHLGCATAEEAISIAQRFYPEKEIPIRNRLILQDVFEEKKAGNPYSATIGW